MRRSNAPSQVSKRQKTTSKPFKAPSKAGSSFVRLNKQPGFPSKMLMRHKYIDNFTLASTSGALTSYAFRANGMFDPNATATGHQPLYFDQMSAIYDHYTVIGSTIKISAAASSGNTIPFLVCVFQNDDTTVVPTSAIACAEQSNAQLRFIGGQNPEKAVIVQKYSAKGTFGGSVLGNDNLQGTSGADPTEQSIWSIVQQSHEITGSSTCNYVVEIEYLAVWDELKDVAQS